MFSSECQRVTYSKRCGISVFRIFGLQQVMRTVKLDSCRNSCQYLVSHSGNFGEKESEGVIKVFF